MYDPVNRTAPLNTAQDVPASEFQELDSNEQDIDSSSQDQSKYATEWELPSEDPAERVD